MKKNPFVTKRSKPKPALPDPSSPKAPRDPKPKVPGGPLPTPPERIRRRSHRRRVNPNVPTLEKLVARAAKLEIPNITVFPETVAKPKNSHQGRYLVNTKCRKCGREMLQVLTGLEKGTHRKCGCIPVVRSVQKTILYSLKIRYYAMSQRCNRDTHVSSSNYKGRGIQLHFKSCDEFVKWALAEFPEQAVTGFKRWDFDRIDNDGHYAKENLRLVRRSVNHLNRRNYKGSARSKVDALTQKHPSITYSQVTLRNLFQSGLTEKQILERHQKIKPFPRRPRSKNPDYHTTQSILNDPNISIVYPMSHPNHGTTEF